MDDPSPKPRRAVATHILIALLAIAALPLLIIGVGLFEEFVTGTRISHGICKKLGIFEPLEDLFDGILRALGF